MPTGQVPQPQYERGNMAKGEAQAANQATKGMPAGLQDAADEFVFNRPTDRPDEPVTHGMPFGPGASYVQQGKEDERSMRDRVANQLAASPSADADVLRFAERMRRGE